MLRHRAFFDELAKTKETDANWRSTSAGLVVLRLVDLWIASGRDDNASWGIPAVRDAVAGIDETMPVRRILASVVDAVAESKPGDINAVLPRLMAYAKSLEYDARWPLAIDVYATILSCADSVSESDVVITAHIQSATCFRNLADWESDHAASLRAQSVARAVNDRAGFLRGRVSEASCARSRGNYPLAAQILDEVLGETERAEMPEVRWRALHARAATAGMSGDFKLAVQMLHAALPLAPSQRDRDRMLADLATGLMELGLLEIARDAYLVVNATTEDKFLRWTSAMNMIEIAGLQRAELVFDRYRRELANVEFPPYLHAKYLITVGNGYGRLGKPALAIPLFGQAIEFTRRNALHHLQFEAEECLATAQADTRHRECPAVSSIPSDLADVAEAIRSMVSAAGAGD